MHTKNWRTTRAVLRSCNNRYAEERTVVLIGLWTEFEMSGEVFQCNPSLLLSPQAKHCPPVLYLVDLSLCHLLSLFLLPPP